MFVAQLPLCMQRVSEWMNGEWMNEWMSIAVFNAHRMLIEWNASCLLCSVDCFVLHDDVDCYNDENKRQSSTLTDGRVVSFLVKCGYINSNNRLIAQECLSLNTSSQLSETLVSRELKSDMRCVCLLSAVSCSRPMNCVYNLPIKCIENFDVILLELKCPAITGLECRYVTVRSHVVLFLQLSIFLSGKLWVVYK